LHAELFLQPPSFARRLRQPVDRLGDIGIGCKNTLDRAHMAHIVDAGQRKIGAVGEHDLAPRAGNEQPLLRLGQQSAREIVFLPARAHTQDADCAGKQRENPDCRQQRQKDKDVESGVVARNKGQRDGRADQASRQRQNKLDIAGGIGAVDRGFIARFPARFGYPRHIASAGGEWCAPA
jgi:hypothetical protein